MYSFPVTDYNRCSASLTGKRYQMSIKPCFINYKSGQSFSTGTTTAFSTLCKNKQLKMRSPKVGRALSGRVVRERRAAHQQLGGNCFQPSEVCRSLKYSKTSDGECQNLYREKGVASGGAFKRFSRLAKKQSFFGQVNISPLVSVHETLQDTQTFMTKLNSDKAASARNTLLSSEAIDTKPVEGNIETVLKVTNSDIKTLGTVASLHVPSKVPPVFPQLSISLQKDTDNFISSRVQESPMANQRLDKEHAGLNIVKFLEGKSILVTGATGFLAKVMVEKILRVQPNVGKLYLLIQPRPDASPEKRLTQVIDSELFQLLRFQLGGNYEKFMRQKLTAVAGNITSDGLGLEKHVSDSLSKIVDLIVNSAATTTFDERYDVALNINTLGPKRLLDFAKTCPKLQLLLHVSTAYINGKRHGQNGEKLMKMGDTIAHELDQSSSAKLDLQFEFELAKKELFKVEAGTSGDLLQVTRTMSDLGIQRAQLFGWQDTYVFTKAMGEMILDAERGDVPVVIMRPSVVESTIQEPFPGWMEGIRMLDPIVLAYGKGQMTGFYADPNTVLDIVPADMVVNAILAAMARHAEQPALSVYQVGSSVVNPLTLRQVADFSMKHFRRKPMIDKNGSDIRIPKLRLITNKQIFLSYVWLQFELPTILRKLLPWQTKEKQGDRKLLVLKKAMEQLNYLATLYHPYVFYRGRFDISNTIGLAEQQSEDEKHRFGFDVRSVDWEDYLINIHLPGLREFVLKGRGSRKPSH